MSPRTGEFRFYAPSAEDHATTCLFLQCLVCGNIVKRKQCVVYKSEWKGCDDWDHTEGEKCLRGNPCLGGTVD
jgi:hypothetical protein